VLVEDPELLDRLRGGDERAFVTVVTEWSPAMLRVARMYVNTHASAEEVVQETWLAVLRGLDGFEGRAMFRTWVFRILANQARKRGKVEGRTVPVDELEAVPIVDHARFRGPDDAYPGHWRDDAMPVEWSPEPAVLAEEFRGVLAEALAQLPERQRAVVELRDVHGLDSDEVCQLLGLTTANQRVLLHRGRSRLRTALEERYLQREKSR
jgi:RNA polymerase sigma-70 factor (ECF subfamily)